MKMKSFRVRSCRKSLDPYPCFPERDVPHKKSQFPLGTDIGGTEPLNSDACIICEVSDERVSSCSGVDCLVWLHGECLTTEFGGSEDLANPFCPYCWFKVVSLNSKSLRGKVVRAEKAVYKYLDKGIEASDQGLRRELVVYSSKEDQFDKDSHQLEDASTGMEEDEVEAPEEDEEGVAAVNVQDAEGDDNLAQVQTIVSQTQHNGNGRRMVEMNTLLV